MTWKTSLDEGDLYDIGERYLEGAGVVELAREFRVRTSVIQSILTEDGIPLQRRTLTASTPDRASPA